MRFMMLMIPLGYETAPPDVQLDPERVKAMMKYNEALRNHARLHPPARRRHSMVVRQRARGNESVPVLNVNRDP